MLMLDLVKNMSLQHPLFIYNYRGIIFYLKPNHEYNYLNIENGTLSVSSELSRVRVMVNSFKYTMTYAPSKRVIANESVALVKETDLFNLDLSMSHGICLLDYLDPTPILLDDLLVGVVDNSDIKEKVQCSILL